MNSKGIASDAIRFELGVKRVHSLEVCGYTLIIIRLMEERGEGGEIKREKRRNREHTFIGGSRTLVGSPKREKKYATFPNSATDLIVAPGALVPKVRSTMFWASIYFFVKNK
jgi:hypothetical protein